MNIQIGTKAFSSESANAHPTRQGFGASVETALAATQYRRAETGEEQEAIYRLRYTAYKASDLIDDRTDVLFTDKYDLTPNCRKFGIYIDEELVSTIRIHHLTVKHPYSPAMSVFPDVLMERLAKGDSFIDPSRLAADPAWTAVIPQIPFVTLRLAVAATEYFEATSCLAMVRDDHTAFYRRYFHAEKIAEPRVYPSVTVLGHLYESSRTLNMQKTIQRFPFFRSTALERRLLFGGRDVNREAPTIVLPLIGEGLRSQ